MWEVLEVYVKALNSVYFNCVAVEVGYCEHGNEPTGSIKCEDFLD
jgi:hypothetical protein